MIRRLLGPLLLLTLSGGLCLVGAEMAVRLVRPQPRLVITPGGFYSPDPPGRYRLTPGYEGQIYNRVEYRNSIHINSQGLRGPEIGPAAAGTTRILVLGDSFVFGVGVEANETFTARLPRVLGEAMGGVEALNAGTPAFGVPDAEGWLRRHGLELAPDIVVLAIFLGNDLIDAGRADEEIVIVDGLLAPQESVSGLRVWLHRHSYLYIALKSLLEQPGLVPLRTRLGLDEPWRVRILREEFAVYSDTAADDLRAGVAATDAALDRLVSLAAERGFELLAVLIPSEVQVDPDRWSAGVDSLGLDPATHDPEGPTRIFRELLEDHAIPTLDLSPILTERIAAGEDLYYHFDRHWKVAGHALAAAELGEFILARRRSQRPGLSAAGPVQEKAGGTG